MAFWDEEIERIDRNSLEKLQLKRLRRMVGRAANTTYYSKIFDRQDIRADKIESLSMIRALPFTTKEDLRSSAHEDFLAVPKEEVVRIHVSSGTTGAPTAIYHSATDLDLWAGLVARCLCMAGFTRSDVFQNMTGYGLFTGGLGLHYGAEKLGALVIPVGTGNTRRQVHLMKTFGTTAIHIIPSYALKLYETITAWGIDPKKELNLRLAVIGAEPHTEGARNRIEEGFGLSAFNCYGLSEMSGPGVAFECPEKDGLHIWEDHYMVEIIDPETLDPLPDGEIGELVLTSLCREAMPIIRYRTRDLAMVIPEPCACGRTHRRLSRITGRADDMLILKGVNIFPMQVERVLLSQPEVGGNYVIVLDKIGPLDAMTIRAEMTEETAGSNPEAQIAISTKLKHLLRDELLISPDIDLVAPGALGAREGKAVRVIDNRPRI